MTEITVCAKAEELGTVTAFTEGQLEALDCPMKIIMQVSVAVEEIFVNIASYAYPQGSGTAKISMEAVPGLVSITFTDSGIPFNPLDCPAPDITLSAEERGIGGLGIYMVRKSMDSVTYARTDGCNVLTITRKF